MIVQAISILFNIHSTEVTGGGADMMVDQYQLNYLKDHMGDCVDQALFQYGEGSLGGSQLRQQFSLQYTITNIASYQDAQEIEAMLKNIAKSLISEIGATE